MSDLKAKVVETFIKQKGHIMLVVENTDYSLLHGINGLFVLPEGTDLEKFVGEVHKEIPFAGYQQYGNAGYAFFF